MQDEEALGDLIYEKDGYALYRIDGEENKVGRSNMMSKITRLIYDHSSTPRTSPSSPNSSSTPSPCSLTSAPSYTTSSSSELQLHPSIPMATQPHTAKSSASSARKKLAGTTTTSPASSSSRPSSVKVWVKYSWALLTYWAAGRVASVGQRSH
jgi:hypothetical protein